MGEPKVEKKEMHPDYFKGISEDEAINLWKIFTKNEKITTDSTKFMNQYRLANLTDLGRQTIATNKATLKGYEEEHASIVKRLQNDPFAHWQLRRDQLKEKQANEKDPFGQREILNYRNTPPYWKNWTKDVEKFEEDLKLAEGNPKAKQDIMNLIISIRRANIKKQDSLNAENVALRRSHFEKKPKGERAYKDAIERLKELDNLIKGIEDSPGNPALFDID